MYIRREGSTHTCTVEHNLFLRFQWLSCCSYFFSILFHVLWIPCVRTRPGFSAAASSPHFPSRFYPLQAQHWDTNTKYQSSKYLLLASFAFKRSGSPVCLLLHNSLTRLLHRMPNSHDLPTHLPLPTASHPSLPFSPTIGTALGFEYPFKILTVKMS